MQITLEIDEQTGSATVSVDGGEPQQYASADEALESIEAELAPLMNGADEPEEDGAAMWDEEAAKRPPQSNLMA